MAKKTAKKASKTTEGKLRIGDDWNAITIIALSQSNPLKAVAEFVENSIDAGATQIDIIRGREKGDAYLRIKDNGRGIPKDDDGIPKTMTVSRILNMSRPTSVIRSNGSWSPQATVTVCRVSSVSVCSAFGP